MASGAVFKLNCPVVRWDMSSLVVWHGLYTFSRFSGFLLLKTFTSCHLPHSISLSLFLLLFVCHPCFLPALVISIGKQIWICKLYGKWRSRCVTARTESGQHGHPDMPCMQVKSVYNMAPRGHRTRARSLNGWIPNSSPGTSGKGPPLSLSQDHGRHDNASHKELYQFIPVRVSVSRTTHQTALCGNEMSETEDKNVTCSLPHTVPFSLD